MTDVLTLGPSTVHDVSGPRESFQTAAARHEPVAWRDGKMAAAIRRLMRWYLLSSNGVEAMVKKMPLGNID